MLLVLEVTQRVPPTCIIKISRTAATQPQLATLVISPCMETPGSVAYLKVTSKQRVSIDRTRPCICTYNQNKKMHVRITSTVKVIRTCMFIEWSVLEGTQRVPPTCTMIQISRTFVGRFGQVSLPLLFRFFGGGRRYDVLVGGDGHQHRAVFHADPFSLPLLLLLFGVHPTLKKSKHRKKTWVLILLVLVLTHQLTRKKYRFV